MVYPYSLWMEEVFKGEVTPTKKTGIIAVYLPKEVTGAGVDIFYSVINQPGHPEVFNRANDLIEHLLLRILGIIKKGQKEEVIKFGEGLNSILAGRVTITGPPQIGEELRIGFHKELPVVYLPHSTFYRTYRSIIVLLRVVFQRLNQKIFGLEDIARALVHVLKKIVEPQKESTIIEFLENEYKRLFSAVYRGETTDTDDSIPGRLREIKERLTKILDIDQAVKLSLFHQFLFSAIAYALGYASGLIPKTSQKEDILFIPFIEGNVEAPKFFEENLEDYISNIHLTMGNTKTSLKGLLNLQSILSGYPVFYEELPFAPLVARKGDLLKKQELDKIIKEGWDESPNRWVRYNLPPSLIENILRKIKHLVIDMDPDSVQGAYPLITRNLNSYRNLERVPKIDIEKTGIPATFLYPIVGAAGAYNYLRTFGVLGDNTLVVISKMIVGKSEVGKTCGMVGEAHGILRAYGGPKIEKLSDIYIGKMRRIAREEKLVEEFL